MKPVNVKTRTIELGSLNRFNIQVTHKKTKDDDESVNELITLSDSDDSSTQQRPTSIKKPQNYYELSLPEKKDALKVLYNRMASLQAVLKDANEQLTYFANTILTAEE